MTNIKEVIHLYLGCEVVIRNFSVRQLTGITLKGFYSKSLKGSMVVYHDGFSNCKPILRRLDSMEKADMKLWIDRCTELGLKPIDISDNELRLAAEMFNKKGFGAMDLSGNPELVPHLIAHLLKQGFDLFGLIDSGQAIDKNFKP